MVIYYNKYKVGVHINLQNLKNSAIIFILYLQRTLCIFYMNEMFSNNIIEIVDP